MLLSTKLDSQLIPVSMHVVNYNRTSITAALHTIRTSPEEQAKAANFVKLNWNAKSSYYKSQLL